MKVLAADIGGTKTLLHIAEVDGAAVKTLYGGEYRSQDFHGFNLLLREFFHQAGESIDTSVDCVCLGVPGPVNGAEDNQTVKLTNLPWEINTAALRREFNLPPVKLINDFQAVALAIEALDSRDLRILQPAPAQAQAPRLVLGAGTGLGVAHMLWSGDHYHVVPSEGGHTGFAPADDMQIELLHYLKTELRRVTWEHLVSGPGLMRIYSFLSHKHYKYKSNPYLQEVLGSPDPAARISALAHSDKDTVAYQAVQLFLKLYGTVAGDLALITLPYGGLYIAGGIAPKLINELAASEFIRAFNDKGKMSAVAGHIPVFVVMHTQPGLLGATLAALK